MVDVNIGATPILRPFTGCLLTKGQIAIFIGRFDIESDARQAYLNARKEYGFIESPEHELL